MIVGDFVADFCDKADNDVRIPTGLVREFVAAEQAKLDGLVSGNGTEDASALRVAMQQIMTAKVGIFRTGADLSAAVSELQVLLERSRRIGLVHKVAGANPELATAYRTQKMLKLALCVAYGAAQRTESRGAHFREDFPRRDDAAWLKRTLATWKSDADTLPTLAYEALDVKAMELPPGWRGYGNKDYTDHPDTPQRAAEVARLRESMAGADRHAVQAALMPYAHLLPPGLQGRNERIDEKLP
jgi:fumarate reductase flavoprotein subunit